jgi:hypothetical protein
VMTLTVAKSHVVIMGSASAMITFAQLNCGGAPQLL